MSNVPPIPINLHNNLRNTLLRCADECLASNESMRTLSVAYPLSTCLKDVPDGDTPNRRAELLIKYLWHKFPTPQNNGLIIYIQTLRDRKTPQNQCYTELTKLAEALEAILNPEPEKTSERPELHYPNPKLRPEPPPPLFINREQELKVLSEELSAYRDEGNVYILVGQSGVGKTALAAKLAHILAPNFDHKIFWIPLEKISKTDSIWADIACACGLLPSESQDVDACVYEALCTHHPLVIINHAENTQKTTNAILDKCKGIATVLVLTTDRKIIEDPEKAPKINIDLNPLPRPEAIKLVKERLKTGRFHIEKHEYSIETLCKRLGDLPLALNMATGYIMARKITPQEYVQRHIAESLSEIREACFQLSYKSLSRKAQLALVVLAHSAEKSTAPEAVAAGMGRRKTYEDAEQACAELIRYSLADRREFDGQPRYVLHPVIRHYAKEQLRATHHRIKTRLTTYYSAYIEKYTQDYDALEMEHANLLAAMQYAYDTKKWRIVQRFALRLCDAAEGYLRMRGHWQELRDRLEQAIYATEARRLIRPRKRQKDIAAFTSDLAAVYYLTGDPNAARREYENLLTIYETWENQENAAVIMQRLGQIATDAGEYASARQFYERSLEIFQSYDSQTDFAMTLYYLGSLARKQNRDGEALRYLEQSLSIYRKLNDERGSSDVLHEMGIIAQSSDQYSQALQYYNQSLAIAKRGKIQENIALTSYELGRLEHSRGKYTEAQSHYKISFEIAEHLGMAEFPTIQYAYTTLMKDLMNLTNSDKTEDSKKPMPIHQQILDISQDLGDAEVESVTRYKLALLYEEQSCFAKAIALLETAVTIGQQIGLPQTENYRTMLARVREKAESTQQSD